MWSKTVFNRKKGRNQYHSSLITHFCVINPWSFTPKGHWICLRKHFPRRKPTFVYLKKKNYLKGVFLDLFFLKELELICSSNLFSIILDVCVSSAGVSCECQCV